MAGTVWMRHPSLPPEQLIQVPEVSVPHHQAAGWEVTDAPAKPKPAPRKTGPAPESAAAPLSDADSEPAPADDATEDPAPDAEAATPPKRTRKAHQAQES